MMPQHIYTVIDHKYITLIIFIFSHTFHKFFIYIIRIYEEFNYETVTRTKFTTPRLLNSQGNSIITEDEKNMLIHQ